MRRIWRDSDQNHEPHNDIACSDVWHQGRSPLYLFISVRWRQTLNHYVFVNKMQQCFLSYLTYSRTHLLIIRNIPSPTHSARATISPTTRLLNIIIYLIWRSIIDIKMSSFPLFDSFNNVRRILTNYKYYIWPGSTLMVSHENVDF